MYGISPPATWELAVEVGNVPTWHLVKMHGLGNDYLFLDLFTAPSASLPQDPLLPPPAIRAVCDRHRGWGADGVIALLPPPPSGQAHASMRIWNADGSEGEMCGNGLRCLVRLLYDRGYIPRTLPTVRVATRAGLRAGTPVWQGDEVVAVRADMGVPSFTGVDGDGQERVDQEVEWRRPGDPSPRRHRATYVSMGNPHLVLFVDPEEEDPPQAEVDGPVLEHHPLFPHGVNVGFARVVSPTQVSLEVWERGSGRTLACGTGAAACLAAGVRTGRLGRQAKLHLPGGELQAEWPEEGGSLFLTGPAAYVGPCRFSWPAAPAGEVSTPCA
jgi:diaminopimelate epimerase